MRRFLAGERQRTHTHCQNGDRNPGYSIFLGCIFFSGFEVLLEGD